MLHKILENRDLGNAFCLQVERNDIKFKSGQHVNLKMPDSAFKRPYSIYSGEEDPYLEFLIKEIPGGDTSPYLRKLKIGDIVELDEPEGKFTIDDSDLNKKIFLVGTGTGIAPFRSFIRTYPNLNYFLIHGVKTLSECYDHDDYEIYMPYISREDVSTYKGRVTNYFAYANRVYEDALYYLCGLGQMIYDVDKLLMEYGVPSRNIFWEVYHAERI